MILFNIQNVAENKKLDQSGFNYLQKKIIKKKFLFLFIN